MDRGRSDGEGLEFQCPMPPSSPFKTLMLNSNPIRAEMQENDENRANWLGLERIAPDVGEEGQCGMNISSFHSAAYVETASAGKGKSVMAEDAVERSLGAMNQWDISFGDLLALAEAAGRPGATGHIGGSHDFVPRSIFQAHGGCTTENNGLPDPGQFTYDLNFPPGIIGNVVSSMDMPQFAPMTPCKAGRGENDHVSEAQTFHEYDKEKQGENENEVTNRIEGPSQPDSSVLAVSSAGKNNHNSEEGEIQMLELNKTPQQKPKKRKHRPKVIREDKPKQTPKPAVTPKTTSSKENQTVKRKYVRKANKPATTPAEVGSDSADPKTLESQPTDNSCRRALNFGTQGQEVDETSTQRSFSDLDSESRVQDFGTGELLSKSSTHASRGIESMAENTQSSIIYDLTCSEVLEDYVTSTSSQMKTIVHGKRKEIENPMLNNTQSVSRIPHSSTCSTNAVLAEEASNTNRNGVQFNNLQLYASLLHFPEIYKKRRSEKGQNSTTYNSCNSGPSGGGLQAKNQTITYLPPFTQPERLTTIRSRAITRVRDLASLNKFAECQMQPTHSAKQGSVDGDVHSIINSEQPHKCIEALDANMSPALAKRKRSTNRNYISGVTSYENKMSLHQQIVLYKHQQTVTKLSGGHPKVILWQDLIDAVTEQFKYLDINREGLRAIYQERNTLVPYNKDQNALVLYRSNGTIIPFQGAFNPIRKRHPRPKVELDDETSKVWRLLLENINNEGIDGTDDEKQRWWEEERRVFRGRADSFIARMHLVQGDRRFSRWKGSVVDSTIGVFLTQNVSDHLSSSAFMSLAARYPLKSESIHNPLEEEDATLLVKEPEVCVLDSKPAIEWKKKISIQQVCDQSLVTLLDSVQKDVNSNVSTIDVESSQNSSESSVAQTADRIISYSEELKIGIEPTVTQLLKMAGSSMLHEVSSHRSENVLYGENSKDTRSTSEQSILTAESASQSTIQELVTIHEPSTSCSENNQPTNLQGDESMIIQSQNWFVGDTNAETSAEEQNKKVQQPLNMPNLSVRTLDVKESTISENQINIELKAAKNQALKEINAAKQKSRRVGREIRNGVDWDTLRSEAEPNGKKREKTPSTMDSLDWEAVRCADVNEIAETIKERGMNNMLAERIKAFLNRLVKDHGSIDLEWLRDVPPDKAKEYLLSIRGLGLKSVECIRLLTLHHLAFPVDTNVGRIAVRLGWVPLQPLPESLQLHLLELYPVLESIQKYLWPRLCKLEQKQLYELHYQMITFGKVFCTKTKPNCNACPMRGECRHFASAFASARLALPSPEEKSIVPAIEKTINQENDVRISSLSLPPPQAMQQLEGSVQLEASLGVDKKSVVGSCEPIIEEPASPEPEKIQDLEHDIEDALSDDPDEIPTIKLNIQEFTQNLQNYMEKNMELQAGEMSKALVALTPEAASLPTPKLKNVSRLRTEHQVYELPDSHPLIEGMDKREPDDPCSYLLAIWTPGETATSIQPPEVGCQYQEFGKLCDQKTCFTCNSTREANSQVVRGTLLIPCRTAMRGSFPLNGTYFQVNEVFADHDSSLNPIDVPRSWLWNLPRRTVYFGTSVPSIFKGLPTEGIQHCFWRGYVCVRGFDQKTRGPRPLMARLHFPASKLTKSKGKAVDE